MCVLLVHGILYLPDHLADCGGFLIPFLLVITSYTRSTTARGWDNLSGLAVELAVSPLAGLRRGRCWKELLIFCWNDFNISSLDI